MTTKIPQLREIVVKTNEDVGEFPKMLLKNGIGNAPLAINLKKLDNNQLKKFLEHLEEFLKKLDVHPSWPYPVYIITNIIKGHPSFEVITDIKEAPIHYQIDYDQRPSSKDVQLLQKIYLMNRKIKNLFPRDKDMEIKKIFKHNKKLHDLTKELDFYNTIIRKLNLSGHNP